MARDGFGAYPGEGSTAGTVARNFERLRTERSDKHFRGVCGLLEERPFTAVVGALVGDLPCFKQSHQN